VANVTIRDKESLCLVRPYQDALTLETLFYADEVRDTADLKIPKDGDVRPQELKMAVSLIDNLLADFDPRRYQDNYQEALQRLIDAKAEGRPVPKQLAARGKVVDLMEALRASVEASKKSARPAMQQAEAPARRAPSRRRRSA